ncbi:MAG: polysaccharide biosynthesis/export family protein [Terracidiphilus sp.]|jgi:polysaccharide export outer membrane protein
MKSGSLLMIAILAPGLLWSAQNQEPATTPAVPPATATPATLAPPPAAANDTYVIGPNDVLTVTVWKETTLSGSVLVRPDGMISIPLVGDIQAAGLTPLRLADQITTSLKKFVQDPNVSVVVSSIHSKVVYLIGEVGKTGPIEMSPDMTLLEAISSAGGLSEFANKKKIYILRDQGGKRERIPVHYKEALAGNRALDLELKPGDTIVVP